MWNVSKSDVQAEPLVLTLIHAWMIESHSLTPPWNPIPEPIHWRHSIGPRFSLIPPPQGSHRPLGPGVQVRDRAAHARLRHGPALEGPCVARISSHFFVNDIASTDSLVAGFVRTSTRVRRRFVEPFLNFLPPLDSRTQTHTDAHLVRMPSGGSRRTNPPIPTPPPWGDPGAGGDLSEAIGAPATMDLRLGPRRSPRIRGLPAGGGDQPGACSSGPWRLSAPFVNSCPCLRARCISPSRASSGASVWHPACPCGGSRFPDGSWAPLPSTNGGSGGFRPTQAGSGFWAPGLTHTVALAIVLDSFLCGAPKQTDAP